MEDSNNNNNSNIEIDNSTVEIDNCSDDSNYSDNNDYSDSENIENNNVIVINEYHEVNQISDYQLINDEYYLSNIVDNLIQLRTELLYEMDDEHDIIKELKLYLINNMVNNSNEILKNVYNMLGIELDISIFENIVINNIDNEINYLPELENVICRLDEEVQLDSYTLTEEINKNCNICLEPMIINDVIIKLPCDHIYHDNCINNWLKNYSYFCPCCKKEVGKSKYVI